MKKIVVGILPQIYINNDDNPYNDKYEYLDLYSKKIFEAGGIPIGITLNNKKLEESSLDICDAFLLPGGNKIDRCYYDTIKYAINNNKPLLGICLGMESIAIFSKLIEENSKILEDEDFYETYKRLKEQNDQTLLRKIESPNIHGDIVIKRDTINTARHAISIIDKDSFIYDIYNSDNITGISLHSYTPKFIGKDFKITSKASDGIVE